MSLWTLRLTHQMNLLKKKKKKNQIFCVHAVIFQPTVLALYGIIIYQ